MSLEDNLRFELTRAVAWTRRSLGIRIGKSFIDRFLYPRHLREKYPKNVTIRYDGEFVLPLNTRSWIEWCVFLDGYFEYPMVKLFRKLVNVGDVVFDVGANIGVHTLVLSHLVGETGLVVAVEPCPPIVDKIRSVLDLNDIKNVKLLPYALSDKNATVELFWRSDDTNEGQATFWANGATNTKAVVKTQTLDEIVRQNSINHVNLIKLDIQGAEFQALQGASDTIRQHKPILIFECDWNWQFSNTSLPEVQYFLEQFGYSLYSIDKRGKPIQLSHPPTGEILALATKPS